MIGQLEALGQSWSRAVTSLVWGQWLLVNTGIQATETILETAAPVAGSRPPGETGGVLALARARLRKGLAPPREVYLAPYRDQIDWAQFPDWARPSDPDLFEGCAHEG
jgi:hypothetical protein